MLAVEAIEKTYGNRKALNGVSLAASAGEAVAILGPNGAGKSTLFSILAGLRDADGGRILFEGRAVDADDSALRRALGVVFQSPSLDDLLSARENLVLGAGLFGLGRAEASKTADEMLAWVSLTDRADDRAGTFSGGMKRRLELARALMHNPSILLLDEPTSGLDETGFRQVWGHLDALRRERGLTLLVVTHRGDEAERCDRCVFLDQGRVIAEGSPEELKSGLEGDALELFGPELEEHASTVASLAGQEPAMVAGGMRLQVRGAAALIPRIIDALPSGAVRGVNLRQPTLGDVFVKLTGRDLEAE